MIKINKRSDYISPKRIFVHQSVIWPTVANADSKTISNEKIKQLIITRIPQGYLLESGAKQILVEPTNVINALLEDGTIVFDDEIAPKKK